MTKLIHREGNIWTTEARAIGHGVNLEGVMGAGIALQFKEYFPAMYEEYRSMCQRGVFPPGDIHLWDVPKTNPEDAKRYVFNISTQVLPGANASYRLILKGVSRALQVSDMLNLGTLALPRIGGRIGGLEDAKVEGILDALSQCHKTDIELWTYKP